ncbi:KAP family P-loop NTPase fold protein [Fodinibius sp. Rm-B-1B1-1]|uniref:KAP family P-loop NTPase fold protein n=1 Tax=Fodinibius alkaliphilus TaxID=3140241 RepID=UPI003159E728
MKHTIPPYYERVKEGSVRNDFFNREDFKDNLTNLLSSTEDSLTLTINADWGEGKTTFIKLWKDELEESEQFIPIYYDAFENDFASDAFISIAVTIQEAIKRHYEKFDLDHDKEHLIDGYKEVAKKLGIELVKMGANTTLKLATGGLLKADSIWDILFDKAEELDKRENKGLVSEKYDAFLNRRKTIQEYQEALEALLEVGPDIKDKRIIFFVDELDRCRPDFAIHVIEKIKHLFSVSHVNFVLAINREQLVEIVKHAYGVNEDDAYVYLQKFVHVETNLPTLKDLRTNDDDNLKLYIEELVDSFQIIESIFDSEGLYNLIRKSWRYVDYNPRSIERTLTLFSISISSCREEKKKDFYPHILLLSLLKIHIPPIYKDAKGNGRIMKKIRSEDAVVGGNFIDYLKNDFFPESNITGGASNTVEIESLKEAAKIVDMYDLPSDLKINNIKVKDLEYEVSD